MSALGVRTAIYTALTFIATVLLVVETPATGGYFNLGEAAIYAIAVESPPLVAAIAAGVGPAIADIVLGYWYFAPATLVIKFTEGYVVSRLAGIVRARGAAPTSMRLAACVMGLVLALVVALNAFGGGAERVGLEVYWTPTKILGFEIPIPSLCIKLPSLVWLVIAAAIALIAVSTVVLARVRPYLLPMAIGGMIMVTGYFLYEYFISNPLILHRDPMGALFEVPVNVGQFVAGIVLSHPVVQFVERARTGS